ncbi:hypothetical protein SAMN02745165_01150 [Malonomonas rubra DSM 5091]|uniref:Uncharacterized protein n=1 Tax=Malonomonas rubra DSM 5091 TaxID=1122189 RepID=A0A1M6F4A3_MALRU|nr:hypothetical protein SAMN02745165_01150 [Malonomonas rubra DSM 5091]
MESTPDKRGFQKGDQAKHFPVKLTMAQSFKKQKENSGNYDKKKG